MEMPIQEITIQEATRIIDSGVVFSCRVCSFDSGRKKGGEWLYYPEVKKLISKNRPLTSYEAKVKSYKERVFSRNLVVIQDGFETSVIRKIHPDLLKEFNGRKVIA